MFTISFPCDMRKMTISPLQRQMYVINQNNYRRCNLTFLRTWKAEDWECVLLSSVSYCGAGSTLSRSPPNGAPGPCLGCSVGPHKALYEVRVTVAHFTRNLWEGMKCLWSAQSFHPCVMSLLWYQIMALYLEVSPAELSNEKCKVGPP